MFIDSRRPRRYPRASRRGEMLGAWLIVVAVGAALAALVTALPSPLAALSAPTAAGLSAQIDRAAMIAMAVVVWLLIAWLTVVVGLAVVARLVCGRRHGHRVVTRLAQALLPRALRGVVVAAVGVGSLSAVAGCAPGDFAAPAATSTTAATSLDLDWPLDPVPTTIVDAPAPLPPVTAAPGTTTSVVTPSEAAPAETTPPETTPAEAAPAIGVTTPDGVDARFPEGGTVPASPADPAPVGQPSDAPGSSDTATTTAPSVGATDPAVPPPATEPSAFDPAVPPPAGEAAAPPVAADPTPSGTTTPPTSPAPAPAPAPRDAGATTVTVARGDSLWSLAAAHLPAGASDVDVALAWPAWYTANRDVIGDDPSYIETGWQLVVPTLREDFSS